MFDHGAVLLGEPPASLVEQALRVLLDDPRRPRAILLPSVRRHRHRFRIQLIGDPHAPARRCAVHANESAAAPDAAAADAVDCDIPESDTAAGTEPDTADPDAGLPPLGRLLEAGARRLAVAAEAARERDRASARVARELAGFARLRPAALLDRAEEEIGAAAAASRAARPEVLTAVSEWAVDEVMAAFGISAAAAGRLLVEAVTLDELLPATLAAAERGEICWAAARMLAQVLPRLADPVTRAAVEAELLAGAAGRTVAQLRVAANRAVLRADPDAAAARAAAAIRERAVRLFAGDDGEATLSAAGLAQPVAAAIYRRLEALADAAQTPGDRRSRAQRMADVFVDLLLRGGTAATPPVQVALTLVATADTLRGGAEPGEIDGHPLPAQIVREIAYHLGLLPRPGSGPEAHHPEPDAAQHTDPLVEPGTGDPPAVADQAADGAIADGAIADGAIADDEATDEHAAAGREELRVTPAPDPAAPAPAGSRFDALPRPSIFQELAGDVAGLLGVRSLAGTALASTPQIAIVEEFGGQLLALTDAAELRRAASCGRTACRRRRDCPHAPRGPGLGPPPDTPGYRPSDPLDRFVRARDRRCRFPGCRARPMRCDLDHNVPWPLGPTSHDNLCCLCRHHHRLAHQAPGWRLRRLPDGGLEWTTPGGDRLVTHPPRYGTDDQPPVQRNPAPSNPAPSKPAPAPAPAKPTTPAGPTTLAQSILGRPAQPGDEPAPF